MMDIIKIILNRKKMFILLILLIIQIPLFSLNNKTSEKKVIIKENGKFINELYLEKGNPITIQPTNDSYDFPEYSYIYENEDIIDYKCIENKLYINGVLRGITINTHEDLKLINKNTNIINLNIKIDPGITEIFQRIKKQIFLSINDDVFRGHDLLKIKDLKQLTHLSLYNIDADHNFKNIQYLTNLVYLDLSSANLKNIDLEYIKYLNKLRYLNLNGLYNVNDEGIIYIKDLINIENIHLNGTKISNKGLTYLKSMKNLKYLNLSNCRISGKGMENIKDLKKLEYLILTETKISNIGLKYISNLTNLEYLSLVLCKNFNDNGTKYLGNLKKLKHLYLDYNDLTDKSMSFLKELKNLETLRISRLNVSSESLKYLKEMKKLKILNINNIKLKNSDLKYLESMKDLEELYIENTGIKDKDIEYIADNFKNIKVLNLNYSKISDKSLEYISNLSQLKTLSISNTKVTNKGIKYLVKLKNLNTLYVTDTKADGFKHLLFVSDHAFKYYYKQKRLTYNDAVCIKNAAKIRSGMGAAYPVIGTLKNDEEVTILESGSLRNNINYELLIDYYDEVNDIYIKQGTFIILIEKQENKYLIAVEKNNKKYLVWIDEEYLRAEYSLYLSNELYFYKIKTKDEKTGYINYKFIKKRSGEPTGDTLKELRIFHILVNEEELAKEIRIKIQSGESFEELAKKYSICPSSKDGGDLGWVDEELLIHAIRDKINLIYNPNRITRIIKSKYGYHLILIKGIMLKNQGYRFVFSY